MNNKGCIFLEEGIDFELNSVHDCCILHEGGKGLPLLISNYHGEKIDWEQLFDVKAERVAKQKIETVSECCGCYHLNDYEFRNERKISQFHFSHCRLCNSKCIYCSSGYSCGDVNYDVYPIITDLIGKGYYKSGGEATMQGGEPLLMKNFENLVDLFFKNGTTIRVHSSGIKFSEKVCEALKEDNATIVISIDSSCRETYKKIKRVDAFDNVIENIRKYAKSNPSNIIVKYIIIPGYNDNIKEISKFFDIMSSIGIKTIAVDLELKYAQKYSYKNVSNHIFLLYDYFNFMVNKYNMKLLTYSFIGYILNNRKIHKVKNIFSKFIFGFVLSYYTDKSKNLEYPLY